MADKQKLVTVACYSNSFDASLAKLTLDKAGIDCVILGEPLAINITYGIPSVAVELQVRQEDEHRAKMILQEDIEQQKGCQ
ncbi:MAG TPA: DUF2007 domain-containing protein [Anaerohalosphaeraceae bacterium]|nr:DUF2007 domain-containing protein [Phycisphaerae bacterium]HOK94565.1 DUF2007 domain-containing protein [Anaerohalosphaeraceae bacterium]HOM76874.1 DUF2007 domain-containing protein [Anaerohalosphaeraceae bacterium]HPC63281.1 DUF2007 domain-containing protein [Anaerohalosphaeraceae bacterium]HPO69583.1 DUF2007 domain-containing protein [Anaerohalosphaeraceae bacterium]